MMDKVINLLKDNLFVPKILLTNYKELKIKEQDLIVLIYLINTKDNIFDPKKISEELNIDTIKVLEAIENLNSADLLEISTNKNNGVIEEIIDLNNLYKKLAYLVINEEETSENSNNIYDLFEQEFGRTLSSIEYELISGWLDSDYTEELIECALKEAVFNGVSNLRYIDKILFEWKKKGIKNKDDVLKDKQNFKKQKENKKIEWIDYDYLNEDE